LPEPLNTAPPPPPLSRSSRSLPLLQVWPKFQELNGSLAAAGSPGAVGSEDEAALQACVAVLGETARFHASSMPRKGLAVLASALGSWPLSSALPLADMARILVLHSDGAAAVAAAAGSAGCLLSCLLALVQGGCAGGSAGGSAEGSAGARGPVLTAARALTNAFKHAPLRAVLRARQAALLQAAAALLSFPHASVGAAAAALLHNVAHALSLEAAAAREAAAIGGLTGGKGSGSGSGSSESSSADMAALLGLLKQGLSSLKEEEPLLRLLLALGSVLHAEALEGKSQAVLTAAKQLQLPEAVTATAAGLKPSGSAQGTWETSQEVLRLLQL
jgi:hypothetical protein